MKKSRDYQEHEVVAQLSKKNDIQFEGHIIEILAHNGKGDIGIKSKGKIDFLTNYKGYVSVRVAKFSKSKESHSHKKH